MEKEETKFKILKKIFYINNIKKIKIINVVG